MALFDKRNLTYCPIVRKTEKLTDENTESVFAELDRHFSSVPSQLLQRAADWAYLSETRSSFEIEKEAPNGSKAERFVALLKNAGSFDRLDEDSLCEIQNRIVSTFIVRPSVTVPSKTGLPIQREPGFDASPTFRRRPKCLMT